MQSNGDKSVACILRIQTIYNKSYSTIGVRSYNGIFRSVDSLMLILAVNCIWKMTSYHDCTNIRDENEFLPPYFQVKLVNLH